MMLCGVCSEKSALCSGIIQAYSNLVINGIPKTRFGKSDPVKGGIFSPFRLFKNDEQKVSFVNDDG